MPENRPKSHHYLPQAYLRNFESRHRKNIHYIWRYDKHTGNVTEINIAGVCNEQRLYEVVDAHGVVFNYEPIMGKHDNEMVAPLRTLQATFTKSTLLELKPRLAAFIAFLMMRSPRVRNDIQDLGEYITKDLPHKMAQELNVPALEDTQLPPFVENDAKVQHYEYQRTEFLGVANTLLRLKWMLFENKTPIPFLTSDYPFAIHQQSDAPLWSGETIPTVPSDALFLELPGALLYFPLDPHRLLAIGDPRRYATLPDHCIPWSITVDDMNARQVQAADRFIFSHRNDFRIVEKTIREHPDVLRSKRSRWRIVVEYESTDQA